MSFPVTSVSAAVRRAAAIAFVSLAAVSATPTAAAPVIYDITFTLFDGLPGPLPSAGSFTYNETTKILTDFSVTWNGVTFGSFDFFSPPVACPNGGEGIFALLTQACTRIDAYAWDVQVGGGSGTLSFYNARIGPDITGIIDRVEGLPTSTLPEPQAVFRTGGNWQVAPRLNVPEPGALSLVLVSLGGLGLVHRRSQLRKAVLR